MSQEADLNLSPREAACIATNSYFTLKDWMECSGTNGRKPVAAMESLANVQNRVLGPGDKGANQPRTNPTLANTRLGSSQITNVHSAATVGITSGFGYTLRYEENGITHAIIATRGTRPELGAADLLTDLRGTFTSFSGYGPVHKGFKRTFDSLMPGLERDAALIGNAQIVHCVGHSLGGAVATLVAAHYKQRGKNVRLYTFGSPRVGALDTHLSLESAIGAQNIFRMAHDLDPITLIGPFPFIHVNPAPHSPNYMTILSPAQKISIENHDMMNYLDSVAAGGGTWGGIMGAAKRTDFDAAWLARSLLGTGEGTSGWVQYASEKTLVALFKLFGHVLRGLSTSLILSLSAVDLLAEMLVRGLYKAAALGAQIYSLLKYAAHWAGIQVVQGVEFTAQVIRLILAKMLAALQTAAIAAVTNPTRHIVPMALGVGTAWAMHSAGMF
jgi:triacylglycerol lipase